MNTVAVARLIAAKDLRVERRSKIVTNQVLPFAGITMVSFAFALDKQNVLDTVAPGEMPRSLVLLMVCLT